MPKLRESPIHLGRQAQASIEPPFTGPEWFDEYVARRCEDGADGRLVTQFDFAGDWDAWEVHPEGAEVVICTGGELTLVQQSDGGGEQRVLLRAGEYAVNPKGVWHTFDVPEGCSASCIFITAGLGTRHRPR